MAVGNLIGHVAGLGRLMDLIRLCYGCVPELQPYHLPAAGEPGAVFDPRRDLYAAGRQFR